MKQDVVNVGILGFGTVGSGVIRILQEYQEKVLQETGCIVRVKKVLVRDPIKERAVTIDASLVTAAFADILNDPEIDIVVEVMGGVEVPREYLLQALNAKKHVVTANKDLLAAYGRELLTVAAVNNCDIYFEASVGGGIPVLRGIHGGLSSDHIKKIMGIINGTTNYILTKMSEEGSSYDDVLKKAQRLGFAEADPSSDVDGLDSARKAVILSALGFSMPLNVSDVKTKGIRNVTLEDLKFAKELGYYLKLIAKIEEKGGALSATVQPTLLPKDHPLAGVRNENNAIYVNGETSGEVMFYGPGAGQMPTGTAVVSDILEITKHIRLGNTGKWTHIPNRRRRMLADDDIYEEYLLRIKCKDAEEDQVMNSFTNHRISYHTFIRRNNECIVITDLISKTKMSRLKETFEHNDLDLVSEYPIERG